MEKDFSRNIEAELELEYRLKENYSRIKNSFIDAGVFYRFDNRFSLFGAYRYYLAEDKDRRRISIGGSAETDLLFFSIKYRLKIQHDIEPEKSSSDEFRNRVTFDMPLTKSVKPYISAETFHLRTSATYQFNEYRFTAGIRFDLFKTHTLKLFYTYKESDLVRKKDEITDIAGVKYEYDLK